MNATYSTVSLTLSTLVKTKPYLCTSVTYCLEIASCYIHKPNALLQLDSWHCFLKWLGV